MGNHTRRKFIKSVGATSVVFASGCTGNSETSTSNGGSNGTKTSSKTQSGSPKDSISILTTFYPNANYSGIVAADQFGYFEDVGFSNVKFDYSLEVNPLKVVTGNEYDIVVASHLDSIAGQASGVPIKSIVTTQANTVQSYTYDKEKYPDLSGVDDFIGKMLGLQNVPDVRIFNNKILSAELSDEQRDKVSSTFVGYNIRNLLTGKVDFLTRFPPNADGISLELKNEANLGNINMMDYIDVPGNAAITTNKMINEQPETIKAFTRAHAKGLSDSINADKTEKLAKACVSQLEDAGIANEVIPEGVDPVKVQKIALERFMKFRPIDAWESKGVGWNPLDRVDRAQQLFANAGEIEKTVDPSTIATNKFINEVTDSNGDIIWEV